MLENDTIIYDLLQELGRYPKDAEIKAEKQSRIETLEAMCDDKEQYLNQLDWMGDYNESY